MAILFKKITQFDAFFARSKRYRSSLFQASYALGGSTPLGIACVSSKRAVHKRAVRRNRAKRRLRCAVREALASFSDTSFWQGEVLFQARQEILTCSYADLVKECVHFFDYFQTKLSSCCGHNT